MSRNYVTQAIIFSVKPLGENNSSVCFLTKENGIVYATMYGGPKSKLRSLAAQWNSGTAYLYCKERDVLERNVKLSDFDVHKYHLSFRENLHKMYAASLAAELILRTKCAGSFETCWQLASGFFDGLEIAPDTQCSAGLARFLWRYLALLGVQPDASSCAACGKLLTGNNAQNAVVYEPGENVFLCHACAERLIAHGALQKQEAYRFILSAEAVQYLDAVAKRAPAQSRALPLDESALHDIKHLVFFLAEQAAGTKLKTLETGAGIV
ncbi:MAG: DNA repair protein RecO C-terminal domain-containing protein [Treponema sp.]|nr:DNA repair protein RecO C-terminal domain-containing protein [Treponema sp.]